MKDELFEAQLRRAGGYAPYGGADAGECLATADRMAGTDLAQEFVIAPERFWSPGRPGRLRG